MRRSSLRDIPSVEKVLLALGNTELPRPTVVAVVRRELKALRNHRVVPDFEGALAVVRSALQALSANRIQPVINGTGIIVHTNFGRAPLGHVVIEALSKIGAQYNTLEYGLWEGTRGGRAAYLEHNLALLCKAEAATAVNNNAAALVLILRCFCRAETKTPNGRRRGGARRALGQKNEVIISRGELIQIGGGFRIPEVLESSGARLREVGTTNRTSLADYAGAVNQDTALILRVHRSNFFMDGFVESPATEDLAMLARRKGVLFVEDLGSGAVIKTETILGLEHEPTPAEVLRSGVDLVCFSGDKLLGGPQAGIIAGKAKLVAALKREPFFRALRCDKLILAALQTIVDIYLRGADARPFAGIPVVEMLQMSTEELTARGQKIIATLNGPPLVASLGIGEARIGGGALPRSVIPSVTIDLAHERLPAQKLAARLRAHTPPVIGYVKSSKLKLDLRTIFPEQDAELIRAIRAVL